MNESVALQSRDSERLSALSIACGEELRVRGCTCVSAESCTGGLIAKALTDVPGSSRWFDRAYITYSNLAKQQMLAVPETLFLTQGAVSEAVVRAMAVGALRQSGASLAVSVSGVAGPDGGTAEKPVGTVWLGLAWREGETIGVAAERHLFEGDRDSVRIQSALTALQKIMHRARESFALIDEAAIESS